MINDNYIPLKYSGNGEQKEFPVIWNVNEASTVIVATYTPKDELIKTYVQGTDFSYIANAEPGIGGRVTTVVAPAAGEILVVTRDEPYRQWLELLNSGKLDLASLEKALDHMMMCIQQNRDEAARSIKVPPSSAEPPELLATLIFEARDQALASATNAKKSESNALASEIEAEAAAAEAKATLEAAQEVIAGDLSGAQAAIAADKADALKAIAADKSGAQTAIATDRKNAQDAIAGDKASAQSAIATDKAAALSAMSSARSEALTTIQRAGDTQENRVNAAGAALVATGNDAVARVNAAGAAQIKKIEATGTKTRGDVVLEGDRQVDRVTLVGAEYVKQTHEEAVKAKGEADRAKAEADRAASIAGVDIASATNIGLCPKVGEGLKVTTLEDGSKRLDAVSQVTVVSTPDMAFAAEVAIGYPYTLTLTSGTLIPGAKIAGYEVVVDGVALPTVVADDEGVGTVQITPIGVDLTTGNIAATAVDTEGNRSKIGYKTFLKHTIAVRAPHILSPLTGDTDVALLTAFQIQSFNIYGMPATPAATQLQVARDAAFTTVVYDSGEELAYTTALTLVERLPDGVTVYARARHRAEIYGWSAWGATESFTTVAITVKKPRIIAPIAGAVNQPIDVAVVLSELETTGIPAVPANTRVIVARDEGLTDRVFDTLESSAYSTSVATVNLPINSLLYFTGQHKDAELGWSSLADVSTFTTLNAFVETPSITAPTAVEGIVLKPEFTFSAFSNIGPADSHASTNFQLSRDAGFSDLVVDATITTGDKLRYLTVEELALLATYYARVRFVGTTWGLSAWSAVYVFQTLNAFIAAPVLTGVTEGAVDVMLQAPVTVGAFVVTPTGFDTPKDADNVQYVYTKTDDGTVLEAGHKTFSAAGGVITPASKLPLFTDITLEVEWIGKRLVGQETTLNFKTVDAAVIPPEILFPAQGQTGVSLTPTIMLSAFNNVGPEDTPERTTITIYDDGDMIPKVVASYDGPYLTEWTCPVQLALNTKHRVLGAHKGTLWGWSAPSAQHVFTTTAASIEAPVITTPTADGQLRTANAVVVCNPAVTVGCNHVSTDWKLTSDAAGNNVLAQALESDDKLAHQWTMNWVPAYEAGAVAADFHGVVKTGRSFIGFGYPGVSRSINGKQWGDVKIVNSQIYWFGGATNGARIVLTGRAASTVYSDDDGVTWSVTKKIFQSYTKNVYCAYGNNKYVAVGFDGLVSRSVDGDVWDAPTQIPGVTAGVAAIICCNGLFFACAYRKIATSSDAVNWSVAEVGNDQWSGVLHRLNEYVAYGKYNGSPSYVTSANGNDWSLTASIVPASGGSRVVSVDKCNGLYIALTELGSVNTSPDFITWGSPANITGGSQFTTVFEGKDGVACIAGKGYGSVGSPRVSFRDTFIYPDTPVYCRAKFNSDVPGVESPWSAPVRATVKESIWLMGNTNGTIYRSKDARGFEPAPAQAYAPVRAITFSDIFYVVCSQRIYCGDAYKDWQLAFDPRTDIYAITHGAGRIVAVGRDGYFCTRRETGVWVTGNVPGSAVNTSFYGVCHGPRGFLAVGNNGAYSRSADGETWTQLDTLNKNSGIFWRGVDCYKNLYIAVGQNVSYSNRGTIGVGAYVEQSFNIYDGQNSVPLYSVFHSDSIAVAVGDQYTHTSVDGFSWTPATLISGFAGVINSGYYGDNTFAICGIAGRYTQSYNGVAWNTVGSIGSTSDLMAIHYG